MFTADIGGHKAGEVELPAVTETADGLRFTVRSLSPVSVSWIAAPTATETPEASPEPTAAPTAAPAPTATPAATKAPSGGGSSATAAPTSAPVITPSPTLAPSEVEAPSGPNQQRRPLQPRPRHRCQRRLIPPRSGCGLRCLRLARRPGHCGRAAPAQARTVKPAAFSKKYKQDGALPRQRAVLLVREEKPGGMGKNFSECKENIVELFKNIPYT